MAWEKRGNSTYYYQRKRVNGKSVRVYLGKGAAAEAAERAIQKSKQNRAQIQEKREMWALLDSEDNALTPLITLRYLALGYHRPNRGKWRKRNARTLTEEHKAQMAHWAAQLRALEARVARAGPGPSSQPGGRVGIEGERPTEWVEDSEQAGVSAALPPPSIGEGPSSQGRDCSQDEDAVELAKWRATPGAPNTRRQRQKATLFAPLAAKPLTGNVSSETDLNYGATNDCGHKTVQAQPNVEAAKIGRRPRECEDVIASPREAGCLASPPPAKQESFSPPNLADIQEQCYTQRVSIEELRGSAIRKENGARQSPSNRLENGPKQRPPVPPFRLSGRTGRPQGDETCMENFGRLKPRQKPYDRPLALGYGLPSKEQLRMEEAECAELDEKARAGDVEACKLLFEKYGWTLESEMFRFGAMRTMLDHYFKDRSLYDRMYFENDVDKMCSYLRDNEYDELPKILAEHIATFTAAVQLGLIELYELQAKEPNNPNLTEMARRIGINHRMLARSMRHYVDTCRLRRKSQSPTVYLSPGESRSGED